MAIGHCTSSHTRACGTQQELAKPASTATDDKACGTQQELAKPASTPTVVRNCINNVLGARQPQVC